MKRITLILSFLSISIVSLAQFSYTNPKEYTVGGVNFTGIDYLDPSALQAIVGIEEGDIITVPGERLSQAITKLWEQKLVGDIKVAASKIEGNKIWLEFQLTGRPKVIRKDYVDIKKATREDLDNIININVGQIVTEASISNAERRIRNYFVDKGFYFADVNINAVADTSLSNSIILKINVDKGQKVKIQEIIINGNEALVDTLPQHEARLLSDRRIKRQMEETKERGLLRIFSPSRFIPEEYESDKQNVINYLNTLGYRDASLTDSVYRVSENELNIELNLEPGNRYYFRDITWVGNDLYSDRTLDTILSIRKGDVFNMDRLQSSLNYNPQGYDISSLYLDDGYLFFNVEPVETLVEGDSIDIEIRINEGEQATIRNVEVKGNTKTHDHVVLREVSTRPGDKFSRSQLIRSQQELASLPFFDPQQLNVLPVPNPEDGTVDLTYVVAEKPSDQIELSGGWGAGMLVGSLGLVFNNFSLQNLTNFDKWDPLPSGDAQRLSIRFQSSGIQYHTFSFSFTEPWLNDKPQSFTVSLNRSQNNLWDRNSREVTGFLRMQGATVSLGRELRWPDDYFTLTNSLSFMNYKLENYTGGRSQLGFANGDANNISFTTTISRTYLNEMPFPTKGNKFSLSVSLTPPYSLFNDRDYSELSVAEQNHWVEYHKWMIDNSWYTPLISGKERDLVLNVRAHFGFMGSYSDRPVSNFERFLLGGSGLSSFNFLLGADYIGLRGYQDPQQGQPFGNGINPENVGGVIFDKFVFELQYPITKSPSFSILAIGFLEGGNTWASIKDFNPFDVYKSVGVGTRIMMPAFGLVGIDWGYRLDNLPGIPYDASRSQVTFMIGKQIR